MRKLIFLPLVVLSFLFSCTSEPSFKVKVTVNGGDVDGKLVRVAMLDENAPRDVDSTVVKGNSFVLKGKVSNPDFYLIYIGENGPLELFIENADITVECTLDSLSKAKVTGSASHDLFTSFFSGMEPFIKRRQQAAGNYASAGAIDLPEAKVDSVFKAVEAIDQELHQYMVSFFMKNNQSVVSPFLLNHTILDRISLEQLQQIVDNFAPEISESRHTAKVREFLDMKKRTMVGASFTDFTMTDTLGVSVKLSDYVGKGKYVLMDVWASWCAPCRAANPKLVALYQKYKSRNFQIVGVSLDRERSEWMRGIRDDKLTWPQMSDLQFWQSIVVNLYNINGIPFAILFGPDGKVLYNPIHPDQLDEVLKTLLK